MHAASKSQSYKTPDWIFFLMHLFNFESVFEIDDAISFLMVYVHHRSNRWRVRCILWDISLVRLLASLFQLEKWS